MQLFGKSVVDFLFTIDLFRYSSYVLSTGAEICQSRDCLKVVESFERKVQVDGTSEVNHC